MKTISLALGIFLSTNAYCIDKYDYETLHANCIFESASSNMAEKVAVIHVVLNRVKSKRWPNSIKAVVLQKKQFSWTNDLDNLREPTKVERQECHKAVLTALKTKRHSYNHYFLASIKTPVWALSKELNAIDKHYFLKL